MARALLAAGAAADARDNQGQTPLIAAAKVLTSTYHPERKAKVLETVRALLVHGADVNARTQNGNTALKWARTNQHRKLIELLQRAGAKS